MNWTAPWICAASAGDVCPVFRRQFDCPADVTAATLRITATGVYEAALNGDRIGSFILAPGYTVYEKRLQYQSYSLDVLPGARNELTVLLGRGWYHGRRPDWMPPLADDTPPKAPAGITAQLELQFSDGHVQQICTDTQWQWAQSPVRFAEIFDGEVYDATFVPTHWHAACEFDGPTHTLIAQQGEPVCEQERLCPARLFTTPAGETVLDFGQNLTGYVELSLTAQAGDVVVLSHAEVLDSGGNFFTQNYRSAKAQLRYICKDGAQRYKPHFTFFGFRYIRVDDFPGGAAAARAENFTAIVVHSKLKRTGFLSCAEPLLNRFFENVIWGQKCNSLDIPTDCPQRDERMGWTGDAQIFLRAACLNFDVHRFFTKWLADLSAAQRADGAVGHMIPNELQAYASAAWDDAAVICPWTLYLAHGDHNILAAQFDSMRRWVDYVTANTTTPDLWTGGTHYGDWMGLDSPPGSYKGATREDFIASAFYANSTALLIKAGRVLGRDVSAYEALHTRIVRAFRRAYPDCQTQTELVLAVTFGLASDPQAAADTLAARIRACGTKLMTGFVGTPYLLHVLSNYGHTELAYDLLLRRQYPSWLYPVTRGATTVWEHWDGIAEDGSFWDPWVNSFNHYAYGAVIDWVYCEAAGIQALEDAPGYERVRIAPHPDRRLPWLQARLQTRHGEIRSRWEQQEQYWRYTIDTPVPAEIVLDDTVRQVTPGRYVLFTPLR